MWRAAATLVVARLLLLARAVHNEAHEAHEAAAIQNITLEQSLEVVRGAGRLDSSTLSFIQESLGLSSDHHHNHRRHHRRQVGTHRHHEVGRFLRRRARGEPAAYAPLKPAVQKVSSQIEAVTLKYEVAHEQCCQKHTDAEVRMETIDENIATANSAAAAAQGEVTKASRKIAAQENNIPDEKDHLRELTEKCKTDKKTLESDLVKVANEMDSLGNMDMTKCQGNLFLMQCEHAGKGERLRILHHAGSSPLRESLQRERAENWRSRSVQKLLHEVSSASRAERGEPERGPVFFLQLDEGVDPHQCRMEANPECQQIRDRYLLMTADLEDQRDEVKDQMGELDDNCDEGVHTAEETIQQEMQQLKQEQTALAEATADLNEAMEASRLRNQEREQFLQETNKLMKECQEGKDSLMNEKHGLIKIRGELLALKSINVFIQDCKVSAWTPGECSEVCGGGTRSKTRQVLVQPQGDGAACPPLAVADETCNAQPCPIDCKMGEWGGWSSCSAKCGGGVYERVRDILRHGAHGGKPCSEASETQSCNVDSCDSNCKLGSWTPWSACSKACDGGHSFKERYVVEASQGPGGTCPEASSPKRRQSKACHVHACLEGKDAETKSLKCTSKRDVVLLIDGSASLRESGWTAVKEASAALMRAMGDDVQVSAMVFSGPKTKTDYYKCTGQKDRKTGQALGAANMETDCLLTWVQHSTLEREKVAQKIEAAAWPRGSTMTSEALSLAETELNSGRRDAQAIVVVITDGKPMSKRKVRMASKRLRQKARLMWVAVTKNAPMDMMKKWSSQPWQENVVDVPNFTSLTSKKTLNKIVANMCPSIAKTR